MEGLFRLLEKVAYKLDPMLTDEGINFIDYVMVEVDSHPDDTIDCYVRPYFLNRWFKF